MELVCPICGEILRRGAKQWVCPAGHSFDVARQGYVNLLTVQQKHSLHPGDTREQVLSRRRFLESGAYAPIVAQMLEMLKAHGARGPILDVGCGEGYYGTRVAEALDGALLGLDISKEAVRCAAGSYKQADWICATAAHVPVRDHGAGLLMSMFALTLPEEFRRILSEDGLFLQVLAAQDHLMGLKHIIYPEILRKEKDSVPELPGFQLVESRPLRFGFTAEGAQIQDLLSMTPHFWRISAQGAKRLQETECLHDTASVVLNLYKPKEEQND